MNCLVCPAPGQPVTRALNGAPLGVVLCVDCYEAVRRRQVGISRNPDGSWDVTDGRDRSWEPVEHIKSVTDSRHVQRPAETPAQPRLDL